MIPKNCLTTTCIPSQINVELRTVDPKKGLLSNGVVVGFHVRRGEGIHTISHLTFDKGLASDEPTDMSRGRFS